MFLRFTFILDSLLAMFSRIGLFISALARLGSCLVDLTVVVSAVLTGVGEQDISIMEDGCAVVVRLPVVRPLPLLQTVLRRTEQYRCPFRHLVGVNVLILFNY